MLVVGFPCQKGGAGKTANCVNLAVTATLEGYRTAIIDCDFQASASEWAKDRDVDLPLLAQLPRGISVRDGLPGLLDDARKAAVDIVFIDTKPHADDDHTAVAEHSDVVLISTGPRTVELRAIRPTIIGVRNVGAAQRAAVLLSKCPASKGFGLNHKVFQARYAVENLYQMPVVPVFITYYEDVPDAFAQGLGVAEFAPTGKSAGEFSALWTWIKQKAGDKLPVPNQPETQTRPTEEGARVVQAS